jgi:hypothetical protein
MIASVSSMAAVDRARVFVTGFSMGGCSSIRGPLDRVRDVGDRRPARPSQLEIGWTSREPRPAPVAGRAALTRPPQLAV